MALSVESSTYATSLLDPICDFYQPIPDLQAPGLEAPRTKALTIVFVTALHILYGKRSNDPVFPADKPFRYPGDARDYYYNSSPKSRAFACLDETQLCTESGFPCWSATEEAPASVTKAPAYWLMKYSLIKSNTYDSIRLRLGSALLAQQRVGQSRSLPLPDNHWVEEAEHLFRTSLARAQFDAWSIASGEDHDITTYNDTLPDEAKGRVCGIFKFNSVGYVNILVWPFVLLMLSPPFFWILSLETKTLTRLASGIRSSGTARSLSGNLGGASRSPRSSVSQHNTFAVGSSLHTSQGSGSQHGEPHPVSESPAAPPAGPPIQRSRTPDLEPAPESSVVAPGSPSLDGSRTSDAEPLTPSPVPEVSLAASREQSTQTNRLSGPSPSLSQTGGESSGAILARPQSPNASTHLIATGSNHNALYGSIGGSTARLLLPRPQIDTENGAEGTEEVNGSGWERLVIHSVFVLILGLFGKLVGRRTTNLETDV
jgi:hypothetical protein